MEVTGYSESGQTCVVTVAPDDTLESLKERLLVALGEGLRSERTELRLHGCGKRLHDDETAKVSDTALQAQGGVDVVCPRIEPGVLCKGGVLVTLSPCNRYVAITFIGDVVKVFDTNTHDVICEARTRCWSHPIFAPSSEWLLTTTASGQAVQIHSTRDGTLKRSLDIPAALWTADGRVISLSDPLRVWDLEVDDVVREYAVGNSLLVGSTEGRLVTAQKDGTLEVRDGESGDVLFKLTGHSNHVFHCVPTEDEKMLVSCSLDKTVRIWDYLTGECKHVITESLCNRINASAEGGVVAGYDMSHIYVWSLATGALLRKVTPPDGKQSTAFALSRCGTIAFVNRNDGLTALPIPQD